MMQCLGWAGMGVLLVTASVAGAERYDLVIKSGKVVDGTGAPWYVADVGIREGKIVRIGRIEDAQAAKTLDAAGLIVAPGFIDMMGQTAAPLLANPGAAINLLSQGITTINCGEGVSAAPLSAEDGKRAGYRTMAEHFQLLDMKGLPVNVVQTIGHTQVRLLTIGEVDRRPVGDELERMKALVREAMEAGAIGVSTALIYPPAIYASTEEIAELAKVAGQYGGRYYTHMRNEGDKLLEAIDEALEIGRAGGTPVHIFHLKAAGRQNWGKMEQALSRIKAARAAGQQVTADIYPYVNNGLGIAALIHPRHFVDGEAKLRSQLGDKELRATIRREIETETGWENWFRHLGFDWNKLIVGSTPNEKYSGLSGQSLAAIAKAKQEEPWETFFNLATTGAFVLPESMTEANVIKALQQEFVSFCTDVGPAGGSSIASHPRAFGAFPRMLSRYVRDLGSISLERAVAQASAVAANDVLAYDRGRIAVGLAADIAIFDYQQLADKATFAEPQRLAEGMKQVIVNGELVWDQGKLTGRRPGKVLRGPGYKKPETALGHTQTAPLDRFFADFMEKHRVPGCSVAITNQGRLVYARGFGYSDVAEGSLVTPASLFRIASISKPITAVAVLQLVEQGKLTLDEAVWDVLKLADLLAEEAKFDERQKQITIRHLLQHRGGWDREKSFDAMFQSVRFAQALNVPPPAGPQEVIRNMLAQPLDFTPGERFAYSNYGYCLLGRVIEKLTGQSYEDYVTQQVLAPIGAKGMRLGKTHLEERQSGEVRYYDPATDASVFAADRGQIVASPYGAWYLEAMDAHGGWLASATDLVRFACAFDEPEKCPLLRAETIREMFARPAGEPEKDARGNLKPTYNSLGWFVREMGAEQRLTVWHTGSLPGTATILIKRHDRKNIAVLFNSRVSPYVDHLTRALEGPLHEALDAFAAWPEQDLFREQP